ncbi:DUF1904 family protein [Spiroplasma culicicola]|uniref:Uncharacterized protein n=1 Tax=Spiroplasma culicicola AES-1 TaxID=1276246 RepID=W6A5F1_9MOLU|nr:DUF1904 family protein [Spiroplasma culicicola]AHI52358.1 hypothetical protein SCULI_v1c00170 [Spiroplasma culicicola AES-1]
MPVFSFRGVSEKRIQEYFKKIGELAQLINAEVEQFVFWNEPVTLIGNGYEKDAILITIDWLGRPLKQDAVTKHIQEFFGSDSKNIYVKFTEVNSFLYLNGEVIG